MTEAARSPRSVLDHKRLVKALMAVYGAQDSETAARIGVPFRDVVEIRAEDVARVYEGKRR